MISKDLTNDQSLAHFNLQIIQQSECENNKYSISGDADERARRQLTPTWIPNVINRRQLLVDVVVD